MQNNNSNVSLVPVREYLNVVDQKVEILKENKGKAGIYLFTHRESEKKKIYWFSEEFTRPLQDLCNTLIRAPPLHTIFYRRLVGGGGELFRKNKIYVYFSCHFKIRYV